MSDTFNDARGRKLVSRASAEELGTISDYLLDPGRRSLAALIVGHGRKAQVVDWDQVLGFGPDAVMVSSDAALRDPADEREKMACDGKLALVGRRALTEMGNEVGQVDDVAFSTTDGLIANLVVAEAGATREVPASALLGVGSYAAVLSADQDTAG